ncbi:MAG: hypothetical protein GZ088_13375 [Acidipila sp.]|nr:hypothetical protein [Acidipila sp.]
MGRAATQTRTAIDQQTALQNQINQQLLVDRAQGRSLLMPQFQQMLQQGYSPQQQAAITDQSMGSLGNVYDALRERAGNRLAQTRNSAGYGETLDEMARQEGRDKSGLAQQNQLGFANEEQQRRLEGLQGIASLYGVDTNLLGHGLGIPADLLRSRVAASQGNNGIFNSLLGAIGQIGSSAIGTVGG